MGSKIFKVFVFHKLFHVIDNWKTTDKIRAKNRAYMINLLEVVEVLPQWDYKNKKKIPLFEFCHNNQIIKLYSNTKTSAGTGLNKNILIINYVEQIIKDAEFLKNQFKKYYNFFYSNNHQKNQTKLMYYKKGQNKIQTMIKNKPTFALPSSGDYNMVYFELINTDNKITQITANADFLGTIVPTNINLRFSCEALEIANYIGFVKYHFLRLWPLVDAKIAKEEKIKLSNLYQNKNRNIVIL